MENSKSRFICTQGICDVFQLFFKHLLIFFYNFHDKRRMEDSESVMFRKKNLQTFQHDGNYSVGSIYENCYLKVVLKNDQILQNTIFFHVKEL